VKLLNIYSGRDIFILIISAILENFGYRQLVSWWRVLGSFKALKNQAEWGKPERKGFNQQYSSTQQVGGIR